MSLIGKEFRASVVRISDDTKDSDERSTPAWIFFARFTPQHVIIDLDIWIVIDLFVFSKT